MKSILEKLLVHSTNAGACTGKDAWIHDPDGHKLTSFNPSTGEALATVELASPATYDKVAATAAKSFQSWRETPAPKRGELVRDLGEALRAMKEPLGDLVSLEMGKIRAEGHGEVQEMIDICDRGGLVASALWPRRRAGVAPLGPTGAITAFNTVACGRNTGRGLRDPVWKPAEPTPRPRSPFNTSPIT